MFVAQDLFGVCWLHEGEGMRARARLALLASPRCRFLLIPHPSLHESKSEGEPRPYISLDSGQGEGKPRPYISLAQPDILLLCLGDC